MARPTVSLPVTWDVRAAVDAGRPEALLLGPEDALERVGDRRDLFAPVLAVRQRIPS